MTAWQKLGHISKPTYRRILDPKAMYGVKRIDLSYLKSGTIIITVETEEGAMAVDLHPEDR